MISRAVNLFPYYKQRLLDLGYRNVILTELHSDALYMLIRKMMPKIVFIDSNYKKGDTPFWIAELHKNFKVREFRKFYIAVISLAEYPDDLALYCLENGAKSYVNQMDGLDEFNKGMKDILNGKDYISPGVKERYVGRDYIKPTGHITNGQLRLIKAASNGWTNEEIAKSLEISASTVEVRKSEIYMAMNVRNGIELTVKALRMNLTSLDEIVFYGDNYELKPFPKKAKKRVHKETA